MDKPVLIVPSSKDTALIRAIREGFNKKLGRQVDFELIEDEKIAGGFIAILDGKIYDASFSSRLDELERQMNQAAGEDAAPGFENVGAYLKQRVEALAGETPVPAFEDVGADLKRRIASFTGGPAVYEYGEVESFADDIVHIRGLSNCSYGELLSFDSGAVGLTFDLHLDGVGAALLGGRVSTSGIVRPTGRVAEVCVGDALLGRVIDPLGRPLDGHELHCDTYRPVEAPAPTIMQRAPVNTPLETGILSIDSMIPIGRGQRELIIGDRQTGKTSIALSAILNQRGKGVSCVYCAIGQKASTVSGLVHTLEKAGAMAYTVVVAAFGSDTAAMQYIAPYAACTVAEHFMHAGRDALIVYDDLSKHAVAYRAMSLLLRRPSGREAYPGDVFYLHSRLLERAARLSPELGGGSLTALPIVETMAGDISAYIPTNIISITDGQIYLESELYSAGQRPAINVGLSVSRVGRAAQHSAMRGVSGRLRLDVAQYRDMAVFAQFGADVDASTAAMLRSGERLMELLKQPVEELLPLSEQVAVLLAASSGVFENCPRHNVRRRLARLLAYLYENAEPVLRGVELSGKLTDGDRDELLRQFGRFAQLPEGGDTDGQSE